jgi:exonuclease III
MQVVTWNVARRPATVLDELARIAVPDLVTLQEVALEYQDAYLERLARMGLKQCHCSGRVDIPSKRYGNVIASRWPLNAVELRYPLGELPWPQALAQVSVKCNGYSIVLVTVHIPNGSNNGWEKIDTFQVLAKQVREAKDMPCIVTGDLNEPRYIMQNNAVVTWGQDPDSNGRFFCWGD